MAAISPSAPRVLAVANTKGGSGKSTLAVSIATEAARVGKKVLLVDTDTQRSATLFLGARDASLPRPTGVQLTEGKTLRTELPKLAEPFDLAVIDVGGRDTPVLRNALIVADAILVPMVASAFDTWAAEDVLRIIEELADVRPVSTSAVLNQVERTVVAREAIAALREELEGRGVRLLDTTIAHRTAWPRSIGEGVVVTEWEPTGAAADELRSLCAELGVVVAHEEAAQR